MILKLGNGTPGYLQSALVLRPPGGMPARLRGMSVADVLARLERRDSLVVAIAWLAYGAGAADDNII